MEGKKYGYYRGRKEQTIREKQAPTERNIVKNDAIVNVIDPIWRKAAKVIENKK